MEVEEQRKSDLLERQNQVITNLNELSQRLNNLIPRQEITEIQKHVADYTSSIDLKFKLQRVPSPYYTWTLEQRANYLGAPSKQYLCKSIIMENTECVNQDMSDPFNSRYYLVIIQYTTKIQNQKVLKFVKSLQSQSSSSTAVSGANYRFTLAQSEASHAMTGFEYNAVCPIATKVNIPIVISKSIFSLPNPTVWLGGGETDLKLVVDINEFKEKVENNAKNHVFIADVVYDQQSTTTSNNNNNNDGEE
ncbi:hypothetical protein PPL_01127 [Heterostelium album PN500]|uniref:YbaK/aminoacyl-tRNA synthetase-associated domain-containing protein n=1 Tax=Heterostelium pallidum (strain ATCC 26659 / Pp 5 / PN500) TaxID=670386 RepID=D3AY68_HETP5|nr:hypothetical protein PPL_01127 [Heterostelium album PN500]EFA85895.1 hypothetical protein PPL_01127 [Heterostelium album PN500]|eukprot:XP_020438001.1 hypothetical protein PPL_01127 [Heterostelium album PN500]